MPAACLADTLQHRQQAIWRELVATHIVTYSDTLLLPPGSYLAVNLAWGAGVFFGIIIAGGVSGAHMNPAVTVAMAAHGRLQWRLVLPYVVAQCVGALLASATIYVEYRSALFDYGAKCCNGTTFSKKAIMPSCFDVIDMK